MQHKTIISFDVGIKNLAYCLFSSETTKSAPHQIIQWDVLNLMETTAPAAIKPLCSSCKRKAAYFRTNHYFCKQHAASEILPVKKLASLPRTDLVAMAKNKAPEESAAWTKKQWIEFLKREMLQKWVSNVSPVPSASQVSLITVGRAMTRQLDACLKTDLHIDQVLIENQISPIATRMKTLQGMLTQYFIMRFPNASIEFVSSHNKLTLVPSSPIPAPTSTATVVVDKKKTKGSYKENKKMAVETVWEKVRGGPFETFFQQSKKKDDLADCLLQGLWFVQAKT